jgi:probable HAF family extracellular repeat protein
MDVSFIDPNGPLGGSNGTAGEGVGSAGAAGVATGASSLENSQTVEAPGSGLAFDNSFGLDGTFASLTSSEQAAFETDIEQAESDLSSEFTNSVTLNVDFEAANVPLVDGSGFIASNAASTDVAVSLSSYFNALQRVATSSYQSGAVAAIENLSDLGGSNYVELPSAYARMLGLSNAGTSFTYSGVSLSQNVTYNLSSSMDDTLFLNLAVVQTALEDQAPNTPNESVVGVIEHELSEGGMGRISHLLTQTFPGLGAVWGPVDFFHVDSAGQSDLTPNNGTEVFFSPEPGVEGPASSLEFNNDTSGGDLADWTTTSTSDPNYTDPFGAGGFNGSVGTETSTLSPSDIDIMNVLGWAIRSSGGSTPPLTIALEDDTGASSTDRLTSDPTLTGAAAPNATVTLTENGAALATVTAGAGGAWTFRPTLADGQQTITASESYGAGRTVTASLTFSLATRAPSILATESVSGQTSQTIDTITASATAENVGGDAIAGVEIFDGTADLGPATLSNGAWTFVAQNLLPGAHDFTAKATDLAGNTGSFALPQVTVTAPAPVVDYTLSAFSFTGDGITDIRPKGINDSGEIVGYYLDARADVPGPDGTISYEHGFYSTLSGGVRQYSTIDNPSSATATSLVQTRAFAVADNGDVIGWYQQQGYGIADDGEEYPLPTAGFIMSANWPGTFGTLAYSAYGDFGTHALGINSSDQIVGWYYDGSGEQHGFLRNFTGYGVRGDYISFDPPSSVNTIAEGINDSGEIVGYYETSNGVYNGFTYNSTTGVYSTIDVNGAADTEPLGVNNSGEIVGGYIDSAGNSHGFVRSASGQFTTIDDPNAGSGGTLVSGINNEGEIVGWYSGTDGHSYGFTGVPTNVTPVVTAPSPPNFFNNLDEAGILWQNSNGDTALWNPNGGGFTLDDLGVVNTSWQIAGTGDFGGNGESSILWRNSTNGGTELWNPNGSGGFTYLSLGAVNTSWQIAGTGDFSGDGEGILWRNTNGDAELWNPSGSGGFAYNNLGVVSTSWQIAGAGDFNGNGEDGILWRNSSTGGVEIWNSIGSGGFTYENLGAVNLSWQIAGTGDFTGTGEYSILWRNTNGETELWDPNGSGGFTYDNLGVVNTSWQVVGTGDFSGTGQSGILWRNTNGETELWNPNGSGGFTYESLGIVNASWSVHKIFA